MFRHNFSRFFLAFSAIACLPAIVLAAGQTIHLDVDFTGGSINNIVGSFTPNTNGEDWGIQAASSWRTGSYFGPPKAEAYSKTYGQPGSIQYNQAALANTAAGTGGVAQLASGNVWVYDISMISDVAINNSPGNIFMDRVAGFGSFAQNDGFTSGALVKLQADSGRSVNAGAAPDNGDLTTEPGALPSGLGTDTSNALMQTIHSTYVYQAAPAGGANPTDYSTKISVQTSSGSASHYDGNYGANAPGNFRTDYGSSPNGLYVYGVNGLGQISGTNNPSQHVTYASGVTGVSGGDLTDIPFQQTNNLELGLTHLTFKQVAQADYTTNGQVNIDDGSILVANWAGTGKSFFQGDSTGDGNVNIDDGSILVSQWTAGHDNIGTGLASITYDNATGHVTLDANHVALYRLDSPTGLFINHPTDLGGGRWTVSGTTQQYDPQHVAELALSNSISAGQTFNFGTFQWDYSGVAQDLGALLPAGLNLIPGGDANNYLLSLRYNTLGGQETAVYYIAAPVPEPSTIVLAGLAGVALVGFARRRKVV